MTKHPPSSKLQHLNRPVCFNPLPGEKHRNINTRYPGKKKKKREKGERKRPSNKKRNVETGASLSISRIPPIAISATPLERGSNMVNIRKRCKVSIQYIKNSRVRKCVPRRST